MADRRMTNVLVEIKDALAARRLRETGQVVWDALTSEWSIPIPMPSGDAISRQRGWDEASGWLAEQWRNGGGCRWARRFDGRNGVALYRIENDNLALYFRLRFPQVAVAAEI